MTREERKFQKTANEYAHRVLESIMGNLAAIEHARECNGTKDNGKPCNRGKEVRTYRKKFDAHVPSNPDVMQTVCSNCSAELVHDPATSTWQGPDKCVKVFKQHVHENPETWHDEDAARRVIEETPLSIEVRSDWHTPGEPGESAEYNILLGTGGPACRIIGSLNGHSEPEDARFEYQDWFKPWTTANNLSREEEDALLEFARSFYFGQ